MKKLGTVGNYKILASRHSLQRSRQRSVDMLQVVGAILTFGAQKLDEYSDNQADVMLIDENNNFSVVFAVKKAKIEIITVIDKADCFVKNGTAIAKL